MDETAEATAETPAPSTETPDDAEGTSAAELAQKGGIVVALLVAVVALFVAFQAVTDVIQTWLEPRWVPVWRAVFALGVVALAVDVVRRLTDVSWTG